MNRYWVFLIIAAAVVLLGAFEQRRSAVSPAEEAAVTALPWQTDFATAQAGAQAAHKALFINFTGSDWCPPCRRLRKEVFSQPEFADYAMRHLVLLEVDFPRRKALPPAQLAANHALARRFGIEGYPTFIVLSPDGKVLGQLGYIPGGAPAFLAQLDRVLKIDR